MNEGILQTQIDGLKETVERLEKLVLITRGEIENLLRHTPRGIFSKPSPAACASDGSFVDGIDNVILFSIIAKAADKVEAKGMFERIVGPSKVYPNAFNFVMERTR